MLSETHYAHHYTSIIGLGLVGEGERYHSATIKEHYHQKCFEALDLAITGIEERFNQPGYAIYKLLESLLLKAAKQEN